MATKEELHGGMGSVFLSACVEDHYPDRHYIRDQIAQELLASSLAVEANFLNELSFEWPDRAKNVGMVADHGPVWHRVELLMDELDSALRRYPDDGNVLTRWSPPSVLLLSGAQEIDQSANLEQLSEFCELYRRHQWWSQSPTLELWLVRQMIFAEVFAFGREINVHPSKKMLGWIWAKSLFKWLVGLAAAITIGEQFGWAFGVVVYVGWLCGIRYLANDQIIDLTRKNELFSRMRYCYVVAMRQQPCPVEIHSALALADKERASWPTGLQALVERQMQRNPVAWE